VVVTYNPVSYTTPTDYSTKFTLTAGATLTQRMLVFPEVTKNFDGTTAAVLTTLKGAPAGVSLIAGSGATATFDNATAGTNKTVTFNGYTLGGANAAQYALASNCCGTIVQKTTGTIRPAIVPSIVPGVGIFNPDGSSFLPYVELAMPALFTLASYRSGLMPTYMSDAGDVFFVTKEEEVAAPTVIPFTPPPPYIAPRYAPRPARN
ncbi:MAG: YDG domain-containing protein, partial [Polaromonas sp.]|nr:YDG domain-containing protein [Polaromonas sp.]